MKKKLIIWCFLALIFIGMPVCRAFAASAEDAAIQPEIAVMASDMKYIDYMSVALDHDEDTGYFYLFGVVTHVDDSNYRVKSTLRLQRSALLSLSNQWVEKGSYWEKFTKPGNDYISYDYNGSYETYYWYAAEQTVEVYYRTTVNVIETQSLMSNPMKVTK